jgi:DNA-binding response OmpR family regulator
LVIDDNDNIRTSLRRALSYAGFTVDVAETGEAGLQRALIAPPNLVVLDISMPGLNGFEVCRRLRAAGDDTLVLMLTAKDDVRDKVRGLEVGADDYLVKPFAFPDLLARIRALLRRGRIDQVLRFKAGDLEMDLVTRRVMRGNQTLDLTSREFELLEYLMRHQGHLVSREMLTREVWKEPSRATPLDNVIDVHIARLRKKVDQDFPIKLIHTVRGVGFILREGEP